MADYAFDLWRSFAGINRMQQARTDLLVAQKQVKEPFCIFVCARTEAKILRYRNMKIFYKTQ